jgi:hypothetical protein
MRKILIIIVLFVGYSVFAQESDDDYSGFEAGLNVGAYFGARNTANFYNGAGNEDGMNSADKIINNEHYLNQINEVLEQNGYRYPLIAGSYYTEYPTKMKYTPSIYAGLNGRYWLNRKLAISVSMDFSRLYARDQFVIYNTNPNIPPSNKENQYVIGTIAGQEDRVNIDIGMVRSFRLSDRTNFITEVGFNLNNTTVGLNKIEIYTLVIDIKYKGPYDYVPNSGNPEYEFRQGGIGYGAYVSPGIQLNFTDGISVDVYSNFYYTYISLEHYSQWGLHWAPYIRFNFTRMFL